MLYGYGELYIFMLFIVQITTIKVQILLLYFYIQHKLYVEIQGDRTIRRQSRAANPCMIRSKYGRCIWDTAGVRFRVRVCYHVCRHSD